MSRITDTLLPVNHAVSGFTPSSPAGDAVGVDNRDKSHDVDACSGKFQIFSRHTFFIE